LTGRRPVYGYGRRCQREKEVTGGRNSFPPLQRSNELRPLFSPLPKTEVARLALKLGDDELNQREATTERKKYYRSTVDQVQAGLFALKGDRHIGFAPRSYRMKSFSKWFGAMMAVVVMAGPSMAVDAIVPGKVKSINADKKTFVMTDSGFVDKVVTVHLGADVIINRDGKESNSDLKVGDVVNVWHDNGTLTWTARYILIQAGENNDCVLIHGSVKSSDGKEIVFTDRGKDLTFAVGDAKVQLNKVASKIADVKIGDQCVAIVEKKGDKSTLKALMVNRK
jgi:hypothetical protein